MPRRRRRHDDELSAQSRARHDDELSAPSHARHDDVMLKLILQTQQLNDRLTRLEERVDRSLAESLSQADAEDLMELRLHSARLAAELSRVTIELRAEIDELAQRHGGETPSPREAPAAAPDEVTIDITEEPIIDLTERRARRTSGWRRFSDEDDDERDDE